MSDLSQMRCRGYWVLGNNCGECGHCLETAKDGVAEIRRLRDELDRLRNQNGLLALKQAVTEGDGAVASRLRNALLRVFHRCENWSSADVRANVADALGKTVEELEGR